MAKISKSMKLLFIGSLIQETEMQQEETNEDYSYVLSVLNSISKDIANMSPAVDNDYDVDENDMGTIIEFTLYDEEDDPSKMN